MCGRGVRPRCAPAVVGPRCRSQIENSGFQPSRKFRLHGARPRCAAAVDIDHRALIKLADTVNKKDLVGKIASDASLTRAQASRALDAFVQGIQASLVRGDRVTISGFGTFGVSHRKARRVRNPRSGSDMEVAAKRVPRFAPGADLRTAIDQPASNG